MAKIIVIGGGFAGLTAAAYLSKAGHSVHLFEASPKLGGRAYSFLESETGVIIDNGQHILMGCYKETLKFLSLINAEKYLIYQNKLSVNFVHRYKGITPLSSVSIPYPLNLIIAILKYRAISFSERFKVLKLMMKLPFLDLNEIKNLSIDEWLDKEEQTDNCKKSLWNILAVGALNTNTQKASAYMFVNILREMFLKGNFASTIIVPKKGLSEMYCEDAKNYIEKNNGKIFTSQKVDEIIEENGLITKIIANVETISDFDFVISTIPYYSFEKIFNDKLNYNIDFSYSSILTIHLWLKQNKLNELFYGFIDSPVHWVFNHQKHITIVISDADNYNEMNKEEILEIVYPELKIFLNIDKDSVSQIKIIKEKRATFIPVKEILDNRPGTETKIKNLFLAGDWVNTGLPSTIESAVKSGKVAADKILT